MIDFADGKLEAVFHRLSDLESEYYHLAADRNFEQMDTYNKFLSHEYIRNNRLEEIYWPQLPLSEVFLEREKKYRILNKLSVLEEDALFLQGDITMTKQLTLPFGHFLKNDFFQCVYVLDGTADLTVENEMLRLNAGDFCVMYPNVLHLLNAAEHSVVISILIKRRNYWNERIRKFGTYHTYSHALADDLENGHLTYILFHSNNNAEIRNTILTMFEEYLERKLYFNDVMDGYLILLFQFLHRYKEGEIRYSVQPTRSQIIFEDIYGYCVNHLREASLSGASEKLHFTRQYICRITKEQTGKTFSKMVMDLRIEQVKKYLEQTRLATDIIADLVGFTDAAHLSRSFKNREGISPRQYRDICRMKK